MRYSDGPMARAEVVVEAAPDDVWPFVSDIQSALEFSEELQAVEWIAPFTGPRLGAHFSCHNAAAGIGGWTTTATVTVVQPGHSFGWVVGSVLAPAATWRFNLIAGAQGTTVECSVRIGPGPSGLAQTVAADPEREEFIVVETIDGLQERLVDGLEILRSRIRRSVRSAEVLARIAEAEPTLAGPAR